MSTIDKNKSQIKAESILEAAVDLFVRRGFKDVSMDSIAKQAGVSKQTVYSHFGTKNDLFTAAITAKCDVYHINERIFQQAASCRDILIDFCLHFHDMVTSEAAISIHRTCAAQTLNHREIGELFYQAGPLRVITLLSDYLAQKNLQGELAIDDTEDASLQLILMAQSHKKIQRELGITVSDKDYRVYLTGCVDMFLNFYGTKDLHNRTGTTHTLSSSPV